MTTVAIKTARNLVRAKLIEINWQKDGTAQPNSKNQTSVQFNPASLKVSYSNQIQTKGQGTGAAMQYVGQGDSRLSVELIFDVSGANATNTQDVRKMTEKIANFMRPGAKKTENSKNGIQSTVSGLRFQWGTFLFDGVLESMDETLDLWSEDGRPLRSTVGMSLKQPGIHFEFETKKNPDATQPPATTAGASPVGTNQPTPASKGDNVQNMVAKAGLKADWKAVAARNGIENPRNLAPGTMLNLQEPAKASLANLRTRASGVPDIVLNPFERAKGLASLKARIVTGT